MTVSATQRAQQEKQIAQFLKFSLAGSAVVHLAAFAWAMPLINLQSDGTEEPIEFIVLEESAPPQEDLMPESESVASSTPEAIAQPEAVESTRPEPTPEAIAQPEAVESTILEPEAIAQPEAVESTESTMLEPEAIAEPEAVESTIPEPEAIASSVPEPTPDFIPESEAVESTTPEPLLEADSREEWEESRPAEPSPGMEVPPSQRSDLFAEPLPRQRPLEPYANPAPLSPDQIDPAMNSSPLDPGHSSRIANSNDIQRDQMLRERANLGRLPDPPDVRQVPQTGGGPSSEFGEESPFNSGPIASDDANPSDEFPASDDPDDPFSSNLDRLSDPFNPMEGTPLDSDRPGSGFEADSNPGMNQGPGNGSGLDEIICLRCDRPPYPEIARDNGWEGTVILIADIAPNGTVIGVTVQQSSGYQILDDAATEQVWTWTFNPSETGELGRVIPVTFER